MNQQKRLFPTLRKRLSRFRQKHTYWTLQDSAGEDGFGVVGSPGGWHPYRRLYLDGCQKIDVRSHLHKGVNGVARRLIRRLGLVVLSDIDLPPDLVQNTLQIPNFVDLAISLPATLEDYYSTLPHSARDDIRRTRKANFSYEVCRDVCWTDEFFGRFYLPSMQGRHGDEAYIMSQPEIAALVRDQRAEFVKLNSGGTCIAAMLNQIDGETYTFLRLGWLNNDMTHVRAGAIAALYWFSIQRAFQMQCSDLRLGGTPAYLENGVLRFKAKWGARLSGKPLTCYGHRHLLLDPAHPACYRFLERVSLLACMGDGSYIVLSSKDPAQVAMPDHFLKDIRSWYRLRPDRSERAPCGDELPAALTQWYEKMLISTRCA